MLMVQLLLEPLAIKGPRLLPEGTYKPKSFVKNCVCLEDGNRDKFKNLFHNYLEFFKVI